MSTYVFERLSSGMVKVTVDGEIQYVPGNATIDPIGNEKVIIAPERGDRIEIDVATADITNNGASLTGTADEIAEGLAVSTFFRVATESLDILALQALGSSIKAQPLGLDLTQVGSSGSMVDGTVYFISVYIHKPITVTGIKFFQGTQGSYTADNTNQVGLYTYSGGTLTRVAVSADNGNVWKGSNSSWQTVAFSSPYVAATGMYYVGLLYNSSAQTTAPALGAGTAMGSINVGVFDFTNSAKINGSIASQTALPASQAMSGLTSVSARFYTALY